MSKPRRDRSKMGRRERDVRRRRWLIRRKRKASVRGLIQDNERRVGEKISENPTSGVGQRRVPRRMVGIEISKQKRVAIVATVEQRSEVRRVARRARRRRWDVNVEYRDVGIIDGRGDTLEFDVGIGDEIAGDWGEGNGVVDEQAHSTPPTTLAEVVDKRIAGNIRRT